MSTTTTTVLSVAEAVRLATGKGKVTLAQFDKVKATVGSAFYFEALGAYAVSTRGIVSYADGAASLTELAKATLRDGQKVDARRTALSKLSTVVGMHRETGCNLSDVELFEALRLAHDSTKQGRAWLAAAVKAAKAETDKAKARAALLAVSDKAKADKANERAKAAKAKAEAAAKAAADAKANKAKAEAEAAPTVSNKATWLQNLATVADGAGDVHGLDASALAKANALHAAIGAALAEANGNMRTALANAKAARSAKAKADAPKVVVK